MATLRELITKLSFQTDTKPLESVGKAIEGIKSRLNLLVGIEALKGIANLTDKFGNFALDLRNAAAAAGLTTDEFQKLSYAAAQSGVSQESMANTLKSLNKRLQDARLGSEQAALAFAYAGIPAEQLGTYRNAEEALYAVGKSLNSIQDPIKRASSAQELLGEQGMRLLASMAATSGGLSELSHSAEASAATIGGKNLDAMIQAEQALTGLRSQATALAQNLAASLAPALTAGMKALTKWVFTNQGMLRTDFKEWAKKAAFALGAVAGVVAGLAHDVMLLVRRFMDWGKASGVFKRLGEDFKVIGNIVASVFKAISVAVAALAPVLLDVFESALNSLDRLLRAVGSALASLSDMLRHPLSFDAWDKAFTSILKLIQELARAPFDLVTTAISSLFSAADKLFALLYGKSFKDTWLGQALGALGSVPGDVANMRAFQKGPGATAARSSEPDPDLAYLQGMVQRTLSSPLQAASATQPAFASATGSARAGSAPTVNAPITLNIQGDANSRPVLQAVKEGVAQHFDMVMRQAQAGSSPGVVY